MKVMFRFFFFLYTIAPLIVLPFLAYKEQNGYFLFGIAFSYAGVLLAARKPKWFYPLPIFCIGFWMANGFSIHQYVTLFFFCLLGGFMFYQMAESYDQLSKKGTLENDEDRTKFSKENPNYLLEKMRQWQEENPGKQITFEAMDALAKGRSVRESDLSGPTLDDLTNKALEKVYRQNPQMLDEKIEKWRSQNPGKELTEEIIDAIKRNKQGTMND